MIRGLRRMRAGFPRAVALLAAVTAAGAGCNAILDNRPAKLDPAALSADEPAPGADATAIVDAGTSTDPSCGPGSHRCDGVCVPTDDPVYGCGSPTCAPCEAPHGTATCRDNACALAACEPGRADCNQDASDGCEVDLSKAETCGSCSGHCKEGAPLCKPSTESYECATGCDPAAPLRCGNECVAPLTSTNHCGGCNNKCADVANAQVACADGGCTFTCKTGFHACGAACATDTDPKACGPACVACQAGANATGVCVSNACALLCAIGYADCNKDPADGCEARLADSVANCGACGAACPTGPHATPVCQANACSIQCAAGYADCNKAPADGCERKLADDPENCGACGKSCNGGTCSNGTCLPPPDPDAGP